jgi:hypothetical protein
VDRPPFCVLLKSSLCKKLIFYTFIPIAFISDDTLLGIRDILVRIRIRIPGSIFLTTDPDPDSTPDATTFFIDF